MNKLCLMQRQKQQESRNLTYSEYNVDGTWQVNKGRRKRHLKTYNVMYSNFELQLSINMMTNRRESLKLNFLLPLGYY